MKPALFSDALKVEETLAKAKPITEYNQTIEELEQEHEEITSKLDCEAALREKGCFILDKKAGDLLLLASEHGLINVIKYLVQNKLTLKYKNYFGDTCLHYACKGSDPKMVLYLLEKGIDPNIQNKFLETPLFHAAEVGNLDVVHLLVRYGAELELTDKFGDTALHFAAREGCVEVIDYIVTKCPALLTVENQEGKNALAYALDNSQTSGAQVMKLKGCKVKYGKREDKILELAKKLMDESPNHKKSIFKHVPTKITIFGEKLNREKLEEERAKRRMNVYQAKMAKMKVEKDNEESKD
ncbi:unnamed protein product [Moneuplotes crassus]|uniref:Uncharacterized protein n=1 Tax=Euplotes crassus TaxID=5936 RepID=A0AAD1XR07_EUPCR|nr:unnamed protein product [Moneuplotes crassus]